MQQEYIRILIFSMCSPAVLLRLCSAFLQSCILRLSHPHDRILEGREDHQLREQHTTLHREAARRLHAQGRGEVQGPLTNKMSQMSPWPLVFGIFAAFNMATLKCTGVEAAVDGRGNNVTDGV